MHSNIKFSILCPAYNHTKYVVDYIQSLLNQTYSNFELIIVDDCSTDNTVDIIKTFEDERIKLIEKPFNKGINDSLNMAFENASGDYYIFLASDDMAFPDFLESIVDVINKNPDKGVIYPALKVIDLDDDYPIAIKKRSEYIKCEQNSSCNLLRRMFYKSNSLISPGMVVKYELLRNLMPLDISIVNFQDYQIHINLLLQAEPFMMSEAKILYRYNRNGTSLSSVNASTALRENFETFSLMDTYLKINNLDFLKKVFPDSANEFVDEKFIPFYLGKEALKSNKQERQMWGYNVIMKFINGLQNFSLLNKKEGFNFKQYLQLVSLANVEIDLLNKLIKKHHQYKMLFNIFLIYSISVTIAFVVFLFWVQ